MEVNIAILVMAGGLLALIGLYSFGFRENRQSREDVASAAYADAVLSPLAMALSATNLRWTVFSGIQNQPSANGWSDYCDGNMLVTSDPTPKARSVFETTMDRCRRAAKGTFDVPTAFPTTAASGLKCGLLVLHDEGQSTVKLAFRAAKNLNELMAAPVYYTEVRFQGDPNE